MLVIDKLNKRFGKKRVLKDVSFEFEDGVYGLLGPNGAGKTTLIRCIMNLYIDMKGDIKFNDISIKNNKSYIDHIGYLPQSFGLFKEFSVNEMMEYMCNIKCIKKLKRDEEIKRCLELVNLAEKADDKVATLSGGMIRRLGIAQALLNNPEIIIFDEPTAGLDPEERMRFKDIIGRIKKDRLVIISTHIVSDVQAVCDKIVIMDNGNIVSSGSCTEIEQIAENKVYEVRKNDLNNIDYIYYIEHEFEKNGELWIRIISEEGRDLENVVPTVEDGYLCTIKKL